MKVSLFLFVALVSSSKSQNEGDLDTPEQYNLLPDVVLLFGGLKSGKNGLAHILASDISALTAVQGSDGTFSITSKDGQDIENYPGEPLHPVLYQWEKEEFYSCPHFDSTRSQEEEYLVAFFGSCSHYVHRFCGDGRVPDVLSKNIKAFEELKHQMGSGYERNKLKHDEWVGIDNSNGVYQKLASGDWTISPFTSWRKLQLLPNGHQVGFELLEKYKKEKVYLRICGSIQYYHERDLKGDKDVGDDASLL